MTTIMIARVTYVEAEKNKSCYLCGHILLTSRLVKLLLRLLHVDHVFEFLLIILMFLTLTYIIFLYSTKYIFIYSLCIG